MIEGGNWQIFRREGNKNIEERGQKKIQKISLCFGATVTLELRGKKKRLASAMCRCPKMQGISRRMGRTLTTERGRVEGKKKSSLYPK